MLFKDIPGFERGRAKWRQIENVIRIANVAPFPEKINDLTVCKLTPRHYDQLVLIKSPFFVPAKDRRTAGILVSPIDVLQFLWIISPDNPLNQQTWRRVWTLVREFFTRLPSRDRFVKRMIAWPRYLRFERAIDRYMDRMFLDFPEAGDGKPIRVAPSVSIVHKIASGYGWPAEVFDLFGWPVQGAGIVDMPIAKLWQYRRWIHADKYQSAPTFSKLSDLYTVRALDRWRARATRAGFHGNIQVYLGWLKQQRLKPEPSTLNPS